MHCPINYFFFWKALQYWSVLNREEVTVSYNRTS
jgi:hypothetical protein